MSKTMEMLEKLTDMELIKEATAAYERTMPIVDKFLEDMAGEDESSFNAAFAMIAEKYCAANEINVVEFAKDFADRVEFTNNLLEFLKQGGKDEEE